MGRGCSVYKDWCITLGAVENVTCSRPQLKVPQLRIEPGTAKTGINHSTPASVRSTIYLHILRRSISDHHLKLLCEMPSVIFYTNRNMPLHPKLWGRAGIMTFQLSLPCNKSTPLSQETLEVKPMIFALPHWGKDNTVKTWHLPCTAAAGTKSYCTLIWIFPQGPYSTQ